MTTLRDIVNLNNAITAFGATPPAGITDALAIWRASWESIGDPDQTAKELMGGIADGTITTKTVGKLITSAATRLTVQLKAQELANDLEGYLGQHVTQQIRGELGGQIIEAIRPQFDAHAQAIADTPFSPDTAKNPTQILTLGDSAAQAWRSLPGHAQALDRIYTQLIIPLSRDFNLITPRQFDRPEIQYIAWMIDGNHKANLAAAVYAATAGITEPGGRWHRLHSSGFRLRLNTPAEAEALVQKYSDDREAQANQAAAQSNPEAMRAARLAEAQQNKERERLAASNHRTDGLGDGDRRGPRKPQLIHP